MKNYEMLLLPIAIGNGLITNVFCYYESLQLPKEFLPLLYKPYFNGKPGGEARTEDLECKEGLNNPKSTDIFFQKSCSILVLIH